MKPFELHQGDCLKLLTEIADDSIDMVLVDLPYGITACDWDKVVPVVPMWKELNRVTRRNKAKTFFGTQPFTSLLVTSNLEQFKYEWIWEKTRPTGFVHAKNKPLRYHENILVFSDGTTVHESQSKNRMLYNPQMSEGEPYTQTFRPREALGGLHKPSKVNKECFGTVRHYGGVRFPSTIIRVKSSNSKSKHPTQKPVSLLEYLIRTYTNKGDLVLDFTMGSGSTGVACGRTGRRFVGMELNDQHFKTAKGRVQKAYVNLEWLGLSKELGCDEQAK